MGRRKKTEILEEVKPEKKIKFDIASDAKRSAVAIILFAWGIILVLSFFDASGVVGQYLNKASGAMIGWAKWIFPVFLFSAGVVLLLRKETIFYITKLLGLFVTLLALVSLFHWFFNEDEMLKAAQDGIGGGYLGYAAIYFLGKSLGNAGSFVIIITLFLLGTIIAFNFSIFHFIANLFKKEELVEEDETEAEESGPAVSHEEAVPLAPVENKPEEEAVDPANNIKKIEFVEGPDQYVSSSIKEENNSRGPENNFETKRNKTSLGRAKKNKNKWQLPPLDLLEEKTGSAKGGDTETNAAIIEKTLRTFGIEVERGEIKVGPSVTQYSFRPAVGVKIAKILSLQNDLALALAAHPIRIEAPIPGKSLIGIEVPNKVSATVRLRDLLESRDFKDRESSLTLALGEDVSGSYIFGDLSKMPHLMIAGATGTGKSVSINTVITSLLYQNSPDELKLILVDPKRVELSQFAGIPHLLADVIVDNAKVVNALKWAVGEMERRYRLLQDAGSRDLISYREKLDSGKKLRYTDPSTGQTEEREMEPLPYIVIIIDELADLMGSHGKEVEGAIVRLAQMARAVGIHLIVSTQRPSVEVITGLIKANITTRVAFQVATQIDSRTIIDMGGAEKLLGRGDLLFLSASSPKPKRIQGVFVSESEVKRVVKFIKNQKEDKEMESSEGIGEDITKNSAAQSNMLEFNETPGGDQDDDLFEAAKVEVIRAKKASASLLQRRLRVGYARAARLIDLLEEKGIVGPADGAKPREVYAAENGPSMEVEYSDPISDQEKRDKWQI